jgi:hypothetical protein
MVLPDIWGESVRGSMALDTAGVHISEKKKRENCVNGERNPHLSRKTRKTIHGNHLKQTGLGEYKAWHMTSTSPNKSTETSVKESGQALISLDGRERREGCFLRLRASTSPTCV